MGVNFVTGHRSFEMSSPCPLRRRRRSSRRSRFGGFRPRTPGRGRATSDSLRLGSLFPFLEGSQNIKT